jgi:outer membrane protein assembly factor BamB
VTITGSGFFGVRAVRFAGTTAAFTVRSSSRITALVPAMPSAAGPVTVAARSGTVRSRTRFTVTPRVVLSLATGPPASVVSVSGTGFGAREGVDVFVDTADQALAGTGPAGSFGPMPVTIGASAVPGRHWISAEGRRSGVFAQTAFTVDTNWPQFGYSASHDGYNPYENVLSAANVARIGQDWSFRRGGDVGTGPAVADGIVYVAGYDGNVYALNAATGARRWSSVIEPYGVGGPPVAVAGGMVYASSEGGKMYALNAATGARRWTFNAGSPYNGITSPTVAGGMIYAGSEEGDVYALNAATGARRWTFTTGSDLDSSPAVADGLVYIGAGNGDVYALNAATGHNRWTFASGSGPYGGTASPAVANGVVYVGSPDGNVYALNAANGVKLWTFAAGDYLDPIPAVADGVVYIGSDDGDVYALNAATGARLWTSTTGNGFAGPPAVANGVLYIGSTPSSIYALNAATGARLWTYTTGAAVSSFPAVANGILYIGSEDGYLYAFDLAGGLTTPARPSRGSLRPDYGLRDGR